MERMVWDRILGFAFHVAGFDCPQCFLYGFFFLWYPCLFSLGAILVGCPTREKIMVKYGILFQNILG
jgi:hypothetical protein